jgi:hypothetical protein
MNAAAVYCTIVSRVAKKNANEMKDVMLAMVKAVDAVFRRPVVDVGRSAAPAEVQGQWPAVLRHEVARRAYREGTA